MYTSKIFDIINVFDSFNSNVCCDTCHPLRVIKEHIGCQLPALLKKASTPKPATNAAPAATELYADAHASA
ncbi:hypothetical protein Hanom_Chr09g00833251 [Helianthus anomalus]